MLCISPEETKALGRGLGEKIEKPCVIWLYGELGAGKTVFVKGLAEGLGVLEEITSPTFTIVNEYKGRLNFLHFDLYRLNNHDDLIDIGWEDYLAEEAVIAVEWSERAEAPTEGIAVRFHITPTGREINIDYLSP